MTTVIGKLFSAVISQHLITISDVINNLGIFCSSSSYELFVVSFMQEDVYKGDTALELMLSLQVFS